jgi:hypothetical protein
LVTEDYRADVAMTDTEILDWIADNLLAIDSGPDADRPVEITWLEQPWLTRHTTYGNDLRDAVRRAAESE